MKNTNRADQNSITPTKDQQPNTEAFEPADCEGGGIACAEGGYVLGLHGQAEDGFLAGVELSPSQYQQIVSAAQKSGKTLGEFLANMLQKATESTAVPQPQIAKGFVQINLSTREQSKMRKLAHECKTELRNILRWALFHVQKHLENIAEIKRKTGLSADEQDRFFRGKPELN